MLAGVSVEWFTRLEKGSGSGFSDEVLASVGRVLGLDEDEQGYLRRPVGR
ncbi:hypothetical protein GCM10027456_76750 [Kineosporia babensis]|uniref:Helix-turn-helix domain-containing protein n=1 Tax=Kineosporia babensis TaxID=499548 RepID=A0A9X1NM65_9ACTN|nr:helix-turn-helix domain-containing protein [Kineosporia babensis]